MKAGLTRRGWMTGSAAGLIAPHALIATAATELAATASFRAGGRTGFVLGGVEREPLYIDAMAALGANTARIFFPFRRCNGCSDFGRSPDDVAALHRLLARAGECGMKLVVVGSFAGIEQPAFWADDALRSSFVDNWSWFAATFGQHPALGGLDLMNEPNPPWPSGDIAQAQAAWNPLAAIAAAAIRRQAPSVPIVFEPVAGGNAIGLAKMAPLAQPGVVYSIHFYTPHDITHQRVSAAWPARIPYPADASYRLGAWEPRLGITRIDKARLAHELEAARAFQLRHDVPVYVGEFSCVRWAPPGSALQWVSDALALFKLYGWSWTYHEFRGWPGWDAEIDSTDPDATRRSTSAPVMAALRAAMHRAAQ